MNLNVARKGFVDALRFFKETECNENQLIADVLRTRLKGWLKAPILDVGAGLGDIAQAAFPELDAILLDINEIPNHGNKRHKRIASDFFNFQPKKSEMPRTLLLSHVLQYLDDDMQKLRAKIAWLDPDVVIEVTNNNSGRFGEIISWALSEIDGANPELKCTYLDQDRYQRADHVSIVPVLQCDNFDTMAQHFLELLLDVPVTPLSYEKTKNKLKELFHEPKVVIEGTVSCYERVLG